MRGRKELASQTEQQAKIKMVQEAYAEAKTAWAEWREQAVEDFEFKMGSQWNAEDLAAAQAKGLPALNINHILKNINLISGYQRQNKPDIRVLPIEGSDEYTAEVLGRVIKWVMADKNADFVVSDHFKDALICGLGWTNPYVSFDNDYTNGDIMIKKISPFDLLPDPYFTERDLSDCDYIIRHRVVSKIKLKRLYPKFAETIEKMNTISADDDAYYQLPNVPNDRGKRVLVLEYWYRDFDKKTVIINAANDEDVQPWDGSKGDLAEFLDAHPEYVSLSKDYPVIKLITVVGDSTIVYDGENPFNCPDYPFIPTFCFYESSYATWKLKLQGIVRPLKDLQREKNKRRSQIMAAINTMPHGGWMMQKNAIDDVSKLTEAGGSQKVIEVNPGKDAPQPMKQAEIPIALINLEQMFDSDLRIVGANPDQLGEIGERGAAGITIQLRQKQGLTSSQEVFDSLSFSMRTIGRRLIHYITNNFSEAKIKRILGDDYVFGRKIKEITKQLEQALQQQAQVPEIPANINDEDETVYSMLSDDVARGVMEEQKEAEVQETQQQMVQQQMMLKRQQVLSLKQALEQVRQEEKEFWDKFDDLRTNAQFDCSVDETINSSTYRVGVLATLSQVLQYSKDPTVIDMMIEYMEMPKAKKEEWAAKRQQLAQAQQSQVMA